MCSACQVKKIRYDKPLPLAGKISASLDLRKEIANLMVLSRDLFIKKDILTLLRLGWVVNKQNLIAVFKKNGIDISTEEDLEDLANLYNTGKDKSGALKDDKGNPLIFDVMAIYASEDKTTDAELLQALKNRTLVFA